jgi:site-specific DNA-methyltransferase (adenine-specific)
MRYGSVCPYYQDDSCTIYHGDCLEILPTLADQSIDLVLADPPYGTTACKWDSIIPFAPMWKQLNRIIMSNSAIVMTASQPFTSALVMSNPDMFKHEWVWIKNRGSNFANTVREPMKEHESVIIFSRGKWTYNKQMQERADSGKSRAAYKVGHNDQHRDGTRQFEGRGHHDISELRVPSSWQKFNIASGKEKTKHPTQKPVLLFEYFIKTYSNSGEMVLDFALGSGTTLVSAKNMGRKAIGIELEEKYCEIAAERLQQEYMQF